MQHPNITLINNSNNKKALANYILNNYYDFIFNRM